MKLKPVFFGTLAAAGCVAHAQSWTLFSKTSPMTPVDNQPYASNHCPTPCISTIITFDFSPMCARNECTGDNPNPGPPWDSPWQSLFYNTPLSFNDTVVISDSRTGYYAQSVEYYETSGVETWVFDSNTQASRDYDVVNTRVTYHLYFVPFGSGGTG
ncbi:MAG: hypothetical protein ACYC96_02155 [Fimbriimonadaceae bacterium]